MSLSEQETARPLLTPGEILQLPADNSLVLVSGRPPIRAQKLRYYADRNFLERRRAAPDVPAHRMHDASVHADDWSGMTRAVHPKLDKAWAEIVAAEQDRLQVRERVQPKRQPDRHGDLPLFSERALELEQNPAAHDAPALGEENVINFPGVRV